MSLDQRRTPDHSPRRWLQRGPREAGESPGRWLRQETRRTGASPGSRTDVEAITLNSPDSVDAETAQGVLRALVPNCDVAVFGRLVREDVRTADDLAGLDKDDLCVLGLSMVERSRVLRWASLRVGSPVAAACRTVSSNAVFPPETGGTPRPSLASLNGSQQADFWCSISVDSPLLARLRGALEGGNLSDVRENLLESLFDLTPNRVMEVFDAMRESNDDGQVTSVELAAELSRIGLAGPDKDDLERIFELAASNREEGLQFSEFELIMSRFLLAQLFAEDAAGSFHAAARRLLVILDFTPRGAHLADVSDVQAVRSFFFGSRPMPTHAGDALPVRWVHLRDIDVRLFLALGVKYGLHPLAVEDVFEQGGTKSDRYGQQHFVTIERLSLVESRKRDLVQVQGHHVAVFCTGPTRFDTIVTVAQQDASFALSWPGGVESVEPQGGNGKLTADSWAEKLQSRLMVPHSRLLERSANFLLHAILDICADELLDVVRAYANRLGNVETSVRHATNVDELPGKVEQLELSRLQLDMVVRRVNGLQRVVRRIAEDLDLSVGLQSYLQDVLDHLNEAFDEANRLASKCDAIAASCERAAERDQAMAKQRMEERARHQEKIRADQADRQNNILLVLTIVTTIFAPVQFLAGIYGMNFVTKSGSPAIPELLWTHGYLYFWGLTVTYLVVTGTLTFCCLRDQWAVSGTNEETRPLLDGSPRCNAGSNDPAVPV
mmetsp:Transcript_40336/g.111093  ORF Transcript_40336/g.111093 Transcript_40336/m.111093 type:complete len:723 (+) Transcript_40336:91-2259(+)